MELGRPFGIPVRLHGSFWALALFFAAMGALQGGLGGLLGACVGLVGLAASVILHELGHALAARRYGIGTESITLYPFGGVAAINRMPEDPDQELVIAVAGPAVNAMLAAAFGWVAFLTGSPLAGIMATMNLGMGLFNLIPAFPMDGGRVLRALLARRMGFLPASRLAVRTGRWFAWAFIAFGLLRWWPTLVLVGIFLHVALRQEHERLVWLTWARATGRRPPWEPEAPSFPFHR